MSGTRDGVIELRLEREIFSLWGVRSSKGSQEGNSQTQDEPPLASSRHWQTYFFELNSPILFSTDLHKVLIGPDFRIYPPSQIASGRGPEILSEVIYVPVGKDDVEFAQRIKYETVTGFVYSVNHNRKIQIFRGHGLRIDVFGEMRRALEVQRKFLARVRSLTFQWWLLGRDNPFDLGARYLSDVSENFEPTDILPDGTPMHPMQAQFLFMGLEKAVGPPHWNYLSSMASSSFPDDQANSLFCDALEKFFSFDDVTAALLLALSLEAAENEMRRMKNQVIHNDPIRNLTKHPQILKYGNEAVLKQLFVDRGHIAHANTPPYLSNGSATIKGYFVEAIRVLYAREKSLRGELNENTQIIAQIKNL